jgi:hypothetical protein
MVRRTASIRLAWPLMTLSQVGESESSNRRIVHHRHRDQHRSHADQRVHRRDQLGHLRHLHAACDERADRASDQHHAEYQPDAVPRDDCKCRQDRDRHARHAEVVPAARGLGMGQSFQREDETHRGDEVPQSHLVDGHDGVSPCSFLVIDLPFTPRSLLRFFTRDDHPHAVAAEADLTARAGDRPRAAELFRRAAGLAHGAAERDALLERAAQNAS